MFQASGARPEEKCASNEHNRLVPILEEVQANALRARVFAMTNFVIAACAIGILRWCVFIGFLYGIDGGLGLVFHEIVVVTYVCIECWCDCLVED